MSGFRVSSPPIRGRAVVTVELDASPLTVKRTHKTELIIKTNGGELAIPISCYVDYPKAVLTPPLHELRRHGENSEKFSRHSKTSSRLGVILGVATFLFWL